MVDIFSSFEIRFDDGSKPEKFEYNDFRWALNAAKGYAKMKNKAVIILEKGKMVGKVLSDGKYENFC